VAGTRGAGLTWLCVFADCYDPGGPDPYEGYGQDELGEYAAVKPSHHVLAAGFCVRKGNMYRMKKGNLECFAGSRGPDWCR